MGDEPAPEKDPLQSLKEADQRRGGCGAFLVGAVAFSLVFFPLLFLTFSTIKPQKENAGTTMACLAGIFVAGIAAAIRAAGLFTRLRVQRMDRKAREAKDKPAEPTSP
jgi:hypothetical protein